MKSTRRIFWILLLCLIVFLIVYGVVPSVNAAVNATAMKYGGDIYITLSGFAASVAANSIYQQYHALIWLVGGVILTVSVIKLWSRRPKIFGKKTQESQAYQHEMQSSLPQTTPEQVTQPITEPKKEAVKEEVVAE